jgi:hypothetical protein
MVQDQKHKLSCAECRRGFNAINRVRGGNEVANTRTVYQVGVDRQRHHDELIFGERGASGSSEDISFSYSRNDDETNAHLNSLSQIQFYILFEIGEFSAEELLGGGRLRRLVSSYPMTRRDDIHFQSEDTGRDYGDRRITIKRRCQQRYWWKVYLDCKKPWMKPLYRNNWGLKATKNSRAETYRWQFLHFSELSTR